MGILRFVFLAIIILAAAWTDQMMSRNSPLSPTPLSPALTACMARFDALPLGADSARLVELNALADWTTDQLLASGSASLTFICTHNSRRSHMAHLWTAAAAAHFGLTGVHAYSGGTEATAFNERTVAALTRSGFRIEAETDGNNPVYRVRWSDGHAGERCFSKRYTDPVNPAQGFAAIMTCGEADAECPLVFGSAVRFAVPYLDPKTSDGSPEEAAAYDARSEQIGREMHHVMSRVAARLVGS